MSAMHWEARRRQSALDRRNQLQLVQKSAESHGDAAESKTQQEQTAQASTARCPHCEAASKAPPHHGGKIPNRYSSLQYSQQW